MGIAIRNSPRKWGSLFAFRRENGDRYSQFAAKMGIVIRNSPRKWGSLFAIRRENGDCYTAD